MKSVLRYLAGVAAAAVLVTASIAGMPLAASASTVPVAAARVKIVGAKNGAFSVSSIALPKGVKSIGVVTGPKHYKKRISVSSKVVSRSVRPGVYTLTLKAVKVAAKGSRIVGTYTPASTKIRFTVKKRKVVKVRPDYTDIVSPLVKVAPPSVVHAVDAPADPADPYIVSLSGRYSPGAVVVSGVSPAAPNGLLVRVKSVGTTSGGATDYTVENATLPEAIPRGSFSKIIKNVTDLSTDTPGMEPQPSIESNERGLIAGIKHPMVTITPATPITQNLKCGAKGTLQVLVGLDGGIDTEFAADWNILSPSDSSVTLTSKAHITGSVSAKLTGGVTCTLKQDIGPPVILPTITVPIGPVPIVITNTLQFGIAAKATLSRDLSVGASATVTAGAIATVDKNGLRPGVIAPTLDVQVQKPDSWIDGTAGVYAVARVEMKVYGLAGPFVELKIGPQVTVDTQKSKWNVELALSIGAGVKLTFLAFELSASQDDIVKVTSVLFTGNLAPDDGTVPPGGDPDPDPSPDPDPGTGPDPVDPANVVSFADPRFERCVGFQIPGWKPGDPVLKSKMAQIDTLVCDGLTSLEGVQYATNLDWLTTRGSSLTDLSPIADLTKLTHLGLSDTAATDMAPIAGLVNLEWIDLTYCHVSDLSPFKNLTNLTLLSLSQNEVSDVSPLAGLSKLQYLYLGKNHVASSAGLGNKPDLIYLELEDNPLDEISALQPTGALTYLSIDNDHVTDISNLATAVNMNYLSLTGNEISTIGVVSSMPRLERVYLDNNHVSDLSPLKPLTQGDSGLYYVTATGQTVTLPAVSAGSAFALPLRDALGGVPASVQVTAGSGLVSGSTVTWSSGPGTIAWSNVDSPPTWGGGLYSARFSGTFIQPVN